MASKLTIECGNCTVLLYTHECEKMLDSCKEVKGLICPECETVVEADGKPINKSRHIWEGMKTDVLVENQPMLVKTAYD